MFHRPSNRLAALACLGAALLVLASCGGETSGPPPPVEDTEPPVVEIVFPVNETDWLGIESTRYDETEDGFLDLRATWSDGGSGVDTSTLRIEVLGTVTGVGPGTDLAGLWRRIALSETGATYEETIEHLVRQGRPRLVVSVADSAGNVGSDTLEIRVRYGDFHRSLRLEGGAPTLDITVCEDDERLYLARGYAITVIDANTLETIGHYPRVLAEPPSEVLCISGDPILYATVRVERFSRHTLSWESEIPGTFGTDAIAWSRNDPDILWVAEWGSGVPVRVDRTIPERLGGVGFPPSSFWDEFTFAIAVLDGDRKIYWDRAWEGGIFVGDPATGEILAHITGGEVGSMAVSRDDRFVYAAFHTGSLTGLAEIDTETDQVTRGMSGWAAGYGPALIVDVVINPAGDRLWLTTQDVDPENPGASILADPLAWKELQAFPRPVPPGVVTRWVQAAAFHPHGKLLYQARDDDIDVYIIR